ncbi:MAG TPA: hypothetical protein VJ842_06055 [Pyrinomonadaceae bacterium]|nr:hypothetical protein [Pyrinomonadaceae bacterium]
MIGNKKKGETDARLDEFGRVLVRAASSNEAEGEAVASQPFLYARVRVRIAAEEERRAAGGETWLALLGVFWRSVPAMALVAVFAFILFWTSNLNNTNGTTTAATSPGVLSDEALMDTRDAGIESVVFADRRALSSDEVLATILSEDEREATR